MDSNLAHVMDMLEELVTILMTRVITLTNLKSYNLVTMKNIKGAIIISQILLRP